MNVTCTWWEYTGDYAPTDRDGVSTPIMRRLDTGEICNGDKLPVGALWVNGGAPSRYCGPDGLSIYCRLPGGHSWLIDGRASNCTMPEDKDHRCWVRHGTVGEKLHVDKNGKTCAAGAGSIAIEGYHGFLHNGELTDVPA
jgi:hypothetical protein